MARRRSRRFRSRPRFFRSKRGSWRGRTRRAAREISPMIAAGLYGAGRAYLAKWISPLTDRIPIGGISDEIGMMLTLGLTRRFIGRKVPMISPIAKVGQYIEMASIGQAIATGQVQLQNMGAGSNGSAFGV